MLTNVPWCQAAGATHFSYTVSMHKSSANHRVFSMNQSSLKKHFAVETLHNQYAQNLCNSYGVCVNQNSFKEKATSDRRMQSKLCYRGDNTAQIHERKIMPRNEAIDCSTGCLHAVCEIRSSSLNPNPNPILSPTWRNWVLKF
ncbi:hypothetical protein BDL97_02G098700 [Sphagnum fallax]|nr:hypothetical protein BDL97_02G098700 [Sphagnum fallax]